MITAVRWLVTLSGSQRDVERLVAESLRGLSATGAASRQLVLELDDPEGDASDDDALHLAKAVVDAFVRHINGFGRLRWGRTFEGIAVSAIKSFDSAGDPTQHVFARPIVEHLLPEEFADMVERLGHARPALPTGIEVITHWSARPRQRLQKHIPTSVGYSTW